MLSLARLLRPPRGWRASFGLKLTKGSFQEMFLGGYMVVFRAIPILRELRSCTSFFHNSYRMNASNGSLLETCVQSEPPGFDCGRPQELSSFPNSLTSEAANPLPPSLEFEGPDSRFDELQNMTSNQSALRLGPELSNQLAGTTGPNMRSFNPSGTELLGDFNQPYNYKNPGQVRKCCRCGKVFGSRQNLRRHRRAGE